MTAEHEAIKELSSDSLRDSLGDYNSQHGMFIRWGELILIAPPVRLRSAAFAKGHLSMVETSLTHPDHAFQERVHTAVNSSVGKPSDAGNYYLALHSIGIIESIELNGTSVAFGPASEQARIQTGDLARLILAPNIKVVATF